MVSIVLQILGVVLVAFVVILLVSSVKIIHQQQVGLVERFGKYRATLGPGPHLIVPIIDRVKYTLDMREAVVPFPPQGVITEDNLMVNIDSVIYYQITDPERAAYEAQSFEGAIEQLTMTTLRNIIGGLDLEQALTSREDINQKLRLVLDDATGKWGIKVNRVELRAIEPPATIRDAMEKGARAERDKRAAVLIAEGQRQAQILSASGDREAAVLRAQGEREAAVLRAQADRQAKMLRAEGEAQAITTVFNAIHAGEPDQALLSYQYLQMLPSLARGDSNKMWIVPSEINDALRGLGRAPQPDPSIPEHARGQFQAPEKIDVWAEIERQKQKEAADQDRTVQQAIEEAKALENPQPRAKVHAEEGRRPQPQPAWNQPPAPLDPAQSNAPLDPGADVPALDPAQTGATTATPTGFDAASAPQTEPLDQFQPETLPQPQPGEGMPPQGSERS